MTGTYPPLESVNGSLGSAAWGGGETFAPLKLDLLCAASSPVKKGQGARSSLPVPYAAALPDFLCVCVWGCRRQPWAPGESETPGGF